MCVDLPKMIFRILVLQLLFAAQFSIGTKFTGIVIGREKGNEHENFLETQDNAGKFKWSFEKRRQIILNTI